MSTIRFEQVSKRYPGAARPAVDNVSLEVPSGTFVVLLGPSGSGKTTLMKMVNRLYEPTGGTITIDGTDIRSLPVTQLRRSIGYVIQQIGLFPHMTVAKNIAVVPKLLGWERQRIEQRTDELLELIHLPPAEYRDRYPAQLSGGQQQRVGIARAMASDPGVLLMDEPFGAIDAITRASLQDELLRVQRQLRKTILFVTHDVEEALRLADRIVVLKDGQLVQYDAPQKLLTAPANQFVHELLGADDLLRQLSQIRVDTAMVAPNADLAAAPQIAPDRNLRSALNLLLQTGAPALAVVEAGRIVGQLDLAHISGAARQR